MAEETKELAPLKADVDIASGYRIPSNVAALTDWARAKVGEYRGLTSVGTPEAYRDAKDYRAGMNRALKQVEAERKRVKVAWTAPLTTFEAEVKSATRELTELRDRTDALIKGYEAEQRKAKEERLRAYWEKRYPRYALCMEGDPLVPFERVFDPDWVKRMGEVADDSKAVADMDGMAVRLAEAEDAINETLYPAIRPLALSELYRTLDPVAAMRAAKAEEIRQRDAVRANGLEPDGTRPGEVPEARQEPPSAPAGPEPVQTAPEPETAPQAGAQARYQILIECATEAEKDRVVGVMKGAGIHGRVRRVA